MSNIQLMIDKYKKPTPKRKYIGNQPLTRILIKIKKDANEKID